jgi:hypothetical protein
LDPASQLGFGAYVGCSPSDQGSGGRKRGLKYN